MKTVLALSTLALALSTGCGVGLTYTHPSNASVEDGGYGPGRFPERQSTPEIPAEEIHESMVFLDAPIQACENTERALSIENAEQRQYMTLLINGRPATMHDPDGNELSEFLPPQTTGYVCLENTGTLTLVGARWSKNKRGEARPATGDNTFSHTVEISDRVNWAGHHLIRLEGNRIVTGG